ncbi:MAG: peptidase [Planctomycetes bacterium]|nr:peptidase [Planctomycetota bacterium]
MNQTRLAPMAFSCAVLVLLAPTARGEVVTLKNGLHLEGSLGKIAELGANPLEGENPGGPVDVKKIVLIDDGLRRVFISSNLIAPPIDPAVRNLVKLRFDDQRVATSGRRVASVGSIVRITPFDEWGRRTVTINTPQGTVDVIQGITEVTPTYTRVQGLQVGQNSYEWDMRLATSSIPRDVLSKVIHKHIDAGDATMRTKVVRLYIQAGRERDAQLELDAVLKDFPELGDLEKLNNELRQATAQRLLDELDLRAEAGQHHLALRMLSAFPAKGVAGELLLKVRDRLSKYAGVQEKGERVLELLEQHLGEISDEALRARITPAVEEIARELNIHTLDRMAPYLLLSDGDAHGADAKLAVAISGWLIGPDAALENLAVASSLYDARNLVRDYLRAGLQHERDAILEQLEGMEGGAPPYVAKLLEHMKPAIELEPADRGLYELTAPGLPNEPDFPYFVQLPPEYDPMRKYPCIVSLHAAGTTPQHQIDWWAGAYSEASVARLGQATRKGYIVLAPAWGKEHQRSYDYTAREHAAVLSPLRDACRRFSIDTDRVYLSGHSIGGDAAWDVGLSHPDLWAGLIVIGGRSDKYISRYTENARYTLPMYFVAGEMDGDWLPTNERDLNRYLTLHNFDAIVVEYQGRGHEHFHDDVQHIFDWMARHRRNFFPEKFSCASMRPWDNFFFWAEVSNFPARSLVAPVAWPERGARAAMTTGEIHPKNYINLQSSADRATIWLAPEMVNFDERISLAFNRHRKSEAIQPTAEVILEDVRTRGDRQHPFWAKVEFARGR